MQVIKIALDLTHKQRGVQGDEGFNSSTGFQILAIQVV